MALTHILYFSRDYTPHDHRFLSALAEMDYRLSFLRLERRGAQLEDRPLPPQVHLIHWAGGRSAVRVSQGWKLLLDLSRVIRQERPDLIHAGPIQQCAFLTALIGFKPLVSMSWGYDLLRDADRNLMFRLLTRFTLKRSQVLIGDCETVRHKSIHLGMAANRIVIFPWGVDLDRFSPVPRPPANSQVITLLSTRGWENIYGVDVIARAFVMVARQNQKARLMLLGQGSQAGLLRRIFMQGGVQNRVVMPGQISWHDLPRYYQQADLYMSASSVDGSSVSLLEAMACGLPAVVSDIPGNREWIEPGIQGWLFPVGDGQALAEVILEAIADREKLKRMGRAARMTAEERADWKKNSVRLFDAYEMALRR